MLFGRRKGDFISEKEIKEYPAEINLDKLNEERNLKVEKEDEEKMDLLDYLDSLPDDEDLEGTKTDELDEEIEEEVVEEVVEEEPKTKWQLLAEFIRLRSGAANLTSKSSLDKEGQELEEILKALSEDETCADIKSIQGEKDIYYYSEELMSDNYAMIALLVDEKDIAKTIAEMVRWNSKTYPCPTPRYYFSNSPYFLTEPQIERAMKKIWSTEEYKDICELETGNKVKYLYSTETMSEKYARSLAESVEYGEYGYK